MSTERKRVIPIDLEPQRVPMDRFLALFAGTEIPVADIIGIRWVEGTHPDILEITYVHRNAEGSIYTENVPTVPSDDLQARLKEAGDSAPSAEVTTERVVAQRRALLYLEPNLKDEPSPIRFVFNMSADGVEGVQYSHLEGANGERLNAVTDTRINAYADEQGRWIIEVLP